VNAAVGQWSEWSTWSTCTKECIQYKKRYCHDVITNKNSRASLSSSCLGESFSTRSCDTTHKCNQSSTTFSSNSITTTNEIHSLSKFDASLFMVGLGIAGVLLFTFVLFALFFLVCKCKSNNSRRRRQKWPRGGGGGGGGMDQGCSKSDLNLYYTCERQKLPHLHDEDECSMFKFLKTSESSSSTSSSGVSSSATTTAPPPLPPPPINKQHYDIFHNQSGIYANMYELNDANRNLHHHLHSVYHHTHNNSHLHNTILVEQQKLLANKTLQHNSTFIPIQNLNDYQITQSPKETIVFSPSAFRPVKNNSSSLSSTSSSNQNTPAGYGGGGSSSSNSSCATKSILISSASPSTNTYYSPPHPNNTTTTSTLKPETYKIISINNIPTLVRANFDGDIEFDYNVPVDVCNEKVLIRKSSILSTTQQHASQRHHQTKVVNCNNANNNICHTEELAYDIADPLGINQFKLLAENSLLNTVAPLAVGNFISECNKEEEREKISIKHIDPMDMCVAMVGAAGAKLSLDCGKFLKLGFLAPIFAYFNEFVFLTKFEIPKDPVFGTWYF
jgi:hypothetical protein